MSETEGFTMNNDGYTMIKWIIPNYAKRCYKDGTIRSKIFTMANNTNITFRLELSCKDGLFVNFYFEDPYTEITTEDLTLTTTFSFLDASNQKVFTESIIHSITNESDWVYIGTISHAYLEKCLVQKDLIILYEIERYIQSPIKTIQLAEEHEIFIVDKNFRDVTLLLGDKTIHAHKGILASRSPVFSAMFTTQMEESINNEVKITNFDYDPFIEVLRFMYTGKIEKEEQLSFEIFKAAHFYQINDLIIVCENILSKNLNFENALKILKLADEYHVSMLLNSCVTFIFQHFKPFHKSSELEDLARTHPHLLMKIIHSLHIP